MVSDLGDAIGRDPEVRQARTIAKAARTRLMACVSSPEDEVDLVEAQEMLDALRDARALAADAEDRVLLHRGLLTPAAADSRAAERRLGITRSDGLGHPGLPAAAPRFGGRLNVARLVAVVLALVLAGAVGVAVARRCAVRLPRARS